jgi:accessory colonization factor AcfC
MYTCFVTVTSWVLITVLGSGLTRAVSVSAQGILHVYGSEGPAPAFHHAATVFGRENNVQVDVVSGPPDKWLDRAASSADVVFSSAGFMMANFVRARDLPIDEASITPLYMRPSAILVRPENPKEIRDFPDLLRPGVKVMVVTGSGQTGLWEDMAGKGGDIRTIRAFRRNIAHYAANSTEAIRVWDERHDIDAWVTWNIWHKPLRDRARLVRVSEDYVIYRQCSVALTERGKGNPAAKQFMDFLTSPEGANIFESWDWMRRPATASPLAVRTDIAIVCRIDSDEWKDSVGMGLMAVRGLVEAYRSIGTPFEELHISAVIHGKAAYWMLTDEAYAAFRKGDGTNPNQAIIRELGELGVSIELCGQTMKEHGWKKEDVLRGVMIVPNAFPRIVDLELQGYGYIRF